jgi:hypothetical protein
MAPSWHHYGSNASHSGARPAPDCAMAAALFVSSTAARRWLTWLAWTAAGSTCTRSPRNGPPGTAGGLVRRPPAGPRGQRRGLMAGPEPVRRPRGHPRHPPVRFRGGAPGRRRLAAYAGRGGRHRGTGQRDPRHLPRRRPRPSSTRTRRRWPPTRARTRPPSRGRPAPPCGPPGSARSAGSSPATRPGREQRAVRAGNPPAPPVPAGLSSAAAPYFRSRRGAGYGAVGRPGRGSPPPVTAGLVR